MDTISRENNPSILPVVAAILGGIGVALGIVAMVKLNTVNKLKADVVSMKDQVVSVAGDASAAKDAANRASSSVSNLAKQAQDGFNQVSSAMEVMRQDLNKLAAARPAAAPAAAGAKPKDGAPAAAPGPGGTYTVKAGDYPAKIARAHGVSVSALMAANPGLEPTKMKVGQTINLPK